MNECENRSKNDREGAVEQARTCMKCEYEL